MRLNLTRRHMLALTGATLATAGGARAAMEKPATRTIEGQAFASAWRITLPDGNNAGTLRAPVDALLAQVDRQMSPWRDDSEISAFNRAPKETPVSAETALVARAALDIAGASDGWFDPTVGPLIARWGFGPISGDSTPRWQGLAATENSLAKDAPGLTMDLCGIAKGHALDRVARRAADLGHGDFLIDLGGELKAFGQHPSGRDWQVAIEDPRPDAIGAVAGLRLPSGMAVATSGLRAQSYMIGERRYSHIMDPRHAAPVDGTIASVSVLAESAMLADGWATALTAADADGPALARRNGIAALFLFQDGTQLSTVTTGGFDRHLI